MLDHSINVILLRQTRREKVIKASVGVPRGPLDTQSRLQQSAVLLALPTGTLRKIVKTTMDSESSIAKEEVEITPLKSTRHLVPRREITTWKGMKDLLDLIDQILGRHHPGKALQCVHIKGGTWDVCQQVLLRDTLHGLGDSGSLCNHSPHDEYEARDVGTFAYPSIADFCTAVLTDILKRG